MGVFPAPGETSGGQVRVAAATPAPRKRGLLWRLLSPLLPDSTRGWGVIPTAEAVVRPGAAMAAPALSAPLLAQLGAENRCRVWRYRLEVSQNTPSRMATVKNALGDTVTITLPWRPPTAWATEAGQLAQVTSFEWSLRTVSIGPYEQSFDEDECYNSGFQEAHCVWKRSWTWVATSPKRLPDPGEPFDAFDESNGNRPNVGSEGTTQAPLNVVGNNPKVNWGLLTFHGVSGPRTCPDLSGIPECGSGDMTTPVCVRVHVDPVGDPTINETTRILSYLRLTSNTSPSVDDDHPQGLGAAGWTPTRAGLELAQAALTQTVANDPKTQCGRTTAVILVTDGESNECNPSNDFWRENRPPAGCPDRVAGEYVDYPPGVSNDMWVNSKISFRLIKNADGSETVVQDGLRTWVIGFSQDVSPCELDLTAYMGRTDASSPNGDAGFDYASNPRLPPTDALTSDNNFADDESHFAPAGGHYAFFANSADELKNAFDKILSSFGTGDYTTSAPVVATGSSVAGNLAFVASTSYPGWRGHLYAYDLRAQCGTPDWDCTKPCGWRTTVTNPDGTTRVVRSNCVWDAGEVLSLGAGTAFAADGTVTARKPRNNGVPRKIYTWNPADPSTLIEVTPDNLGLIRPLVGCLPNDPNCPVNAAVIDFVRGNNGSGNPRTWAMGSVINSTPAVIGAPENWKQNTTESHSEFETEQRWRHQMAWVGASDGMLHAFDLDDGAEILALLPPTMLQRQVQLYQNYSARPNDYPVGQRSMPENHIFGVANSPRFADIWFGSPENRYKTVLFLTEGAGGTGVHAIDVTAPWGRDLNGDGTITPRSQNATPAGETDYGWQESSPVRVLWSKSRADLPQLGHTWSIPALGALDSDTWLLQLGGGWDERFTLDDLPQVLQLDPTDGSLVRSRSLTNQNTGALVRNQSFADAVIWKRDSKFFAQDNLVNQGVQVDLQGRVWAFQPNAWDRTELANVGANNPLYYSPAVAGYPTSSPQYSLYAFSSGSFYEKSRNVNSASTGTTGNFIPKIFIGVKSASVGTTMTVISKPLSEIPSPDGQGTLGPRTQVTASPMIFTPAEGYPGLPFALFLAYDPDAMECGGRSYIVRVDFDPANLNAAQYRSYEGGEGAAAGFAVAGDKVIASYSYRGANGRASIAFIPDITIAAGGVGNEVVWWRELR